MKKSEPDVEKAISDNKSQIFWDVVNKLKHIKKYEQ